MLEQSQIDAICAPFGIPGDASRLISSSQNSVFDCGAGLPILRVSHNRDRTVAQVESELDWIEALAARGIKVCRPRRSLNGRRCECVVVDGREFLVVGFDRAPGRKVTVSDVDHALYRLLGQLTARLHAAAFDEENNPASATARPFWHQSRLLTGDVAAYLPREQDAFRWQMEALVNELKACVTNTSLIHADISFTNVFYDGEDLWLFDFDNCERGPIEEDLATVIYDAVYCHWLNRVPPERLRDQVRQSCQAFVSGYETVRPRTKVNMETLRKFLVLREAVIYVHYCRTIDPAKITSGWRAGMDRMRSNVEQRLTEVDLHYCWHNP